MCFTASKPQQYTLVSHSAHAPPQSHTLHCLKPKLLEAVEEPVRKIAAGARHTLLLTQKGQALAMGYGAFGATGTGSYQNQLVPTPVVLPGGATVRDVAAGWWHSLFVVAQ